MKTKIENTIKIVLMLLFVSIGQLYAQNKSIKIQKIKELTEEKIPLFIAKKLKSGEHQLFFNMPYGFSKMSIPYEAYFLDKGIVTSVDLVFSDFPKGVNLKKLNGRRIQTFCDAFPGSISDSVEWRIVRQTSCTSELEAKQLFHGVVVTYIPKEGVVATGEVELIERMLDSKKLEADRMHVSGIDYSKLEIGAMGGFVPFYLTDTVVNKVLNRNHWKNMSIVADLTGSMSPYTGQLLVWLKLNTKTSMVRQFTFFNDGNNMPDSKKVIGKTGGVYITKTKSFENVKKMAYKTMKAGCGGDGPENYLEAIIKAQRADPDCDHIVLIADNGAAIKDKKLIRHIKKPVKIILCGAGYGINTDYLTLARKTGGSIHTMEYDLTRLMELDEGAELKIGKEKFKVQKGQFVRVL